MRSIAENALYLLSICQIGRHLCICGFTRSEVPGGTDRDGEQVAGCYFRACKLPKMHSYGLLGVYRSSSRGTCIVTPYLSRSVSMTAPDQCGLDALSFFSSHWLRKDDLRTLTIALNDPELALAERTLEKEILLLDNAAVPTPKPLKYGYYKHLLKMFDDMSVPYFALSPRLPGHESPPPSPPGPQHYWRLRDSNWSTEGEE